VAFSRRCAYDVILVLSYVQLFMLHNDRKGPFALSTLCWRPSRDTEQTIYTGSISSDLFYLERLSCGKDP